MNYSKIFPKIKELSLDPLNCEGMTTEKATKNLSKNQYSDHLPYDATLGKTSWTWLGL